MSFLEANAPLDPNARVEYSTPAKSSSSSSPQSTPSTSVTDPSTSVSTENTPGKRKAGAQIAQHAKSLRLDATTIDSHSQHADAPPEVELLDPNQEANDTPPHGHASLPDMDDEDEDGIDGTDGIEDEDGIEEPTDERGKGLKGKGHRWWPATCLPRLINCIVMHSDEYLKKDAKLDRAKVDAKDRDGFWDLIVLAFNKKGNSELAQNLLHDDPRFSKILCTTAFSLSKDVAKHKFVEFSGILRDVKKNFHKSGQGSQFWLEASAMADIDDSERPDIRSSNIDEFFKAPGSGDFKPAELANFYGFLVLYERNLVDPCVSEMDVGHRYACDAPNI